MLGGAAGRSVSPVSEAQDSQGTMCPYHRRVPHVPYEALPEPCPCRQEPEE